MSQALDKVSRELRSAVLGGEHVRARQLATEYAAALRQLWEAMPESERAASTLPKRATELLAWAHGMTVIQRGMSAAQLTVIEKAIRYNAVRSAEAPRPAVQVRG